MDEQQSLNHSKWERKYHVVFIPRCRRKTLYAQLRGYLGEVFRKLAEQKELSRVRHNLNRAVSCQRSSGMLIATSTASAALPSSAKLIMATMIVSARPICWPSTSR
jgi:hypothetical protein